MDKEILRIAIIATGLIVMVAMLISAYLKDKREREDELDYYDDDDDDDDYDDEFVDDDDDEFADDDNFVEDEKKDVKKPSVVESLKNLSLQKMQLRSKETSDSKEKHSKENIVPKMRENDDNNLAQRPSVAPSIIQFSVITKGNDDFNGEDLFFELENLGMEYGSMKIFERIDENRFVHFGVASMLEPGTFPDKDLESFYCPGVVFFMQIDGLDNPKAVFDDYISTAVLFAERMNGVVLDHRRQPLTNEMVEAIRRAL